MKFEELKEIAATDTVAIVEFLHKIASEKMVNQSVMQGIARDAFYMYMDDEDMLDIKAYITEEVDFFKVMDVKFGLADEYKEYSISELADCIKGIAGFEIAKITNAIKEDVTGYVEDFDVRPIEAMMDEIINLTRNDLYIIGWKAILEVLKDVNISK